MNRFFKSAAFPILIVILLAFFVQNLFYGSQKQKDVTFMQFQQLVEQQKVENVVLKTKDIVVEGKVKGTDEKFSVGFTQGYNIEDYLVANKVDFTTDTQKTSIWLTLLGTFAPIILIVVFFLFMMNQMQGGGNKVMSFGKSRAKRMSLDQPKVTFKDVAGVDEAVEELEEIKDFLENPKKFQSLGARIPKGVLLFGPPGTGKTLLARAVAGEAGVPFFSIAGSDFVEMFVGVGASRVRDLFEQAKKQAPCIIFIDEIDAVGRHRGAGMGGGHDEREQTLNQLLVEMDGFDATEGVILVAATNRPDVLDPALLRPGRFDRRVVVPAPDVRGRLGILQVHAKRTPLDENVNLENIAKGTAGFSGAELESLINEAAFLAARENKRKIEQVDLELAKDKVAMGSERRSLVLSDAQKRRTAYHEAGHAIVARMVPESDPVNKITIVPRGMALGLTQILPSEDRYGHSKTQIVSMLGVCMGGRAAEEIVFNEFSTGASNDIKQATRLAHSLICEYGMSEALGPVTWGNRPEEVFLGKDFGRREADYSEATAQRIDEEVRRLVSESYETARSIIMRNLHILHKVAQVLLEKETIDGVEFERIVAGLNPVYPEPHSIVA